MQQLKETSTPPGCCTLNGVCESCLCMSHGGLKRWTAPAVSGFMPFVYNSESQLRAHLNEKWRMLIFIMSEAVLRLLLLLKVLILIHLELLLINYGAFTHEWSWFCEVAVIITVWLPDWVLDSGVPLTFSLLFHRPKQNWINRENNHQI